MSSVRLTPSLFLRIAAVITALYFAGHTAGIPWTPATGPTEAPVLEAMKSQSFEAEGFTRTYWDFYFGFGVIISAFLLTQAIVLWQLAALARINPLQVRPVAATFLVAFLVNAALAWKYFFAVPVALAVLISLSLLAALALAGRAKDAPPGPPDGGSRAARSDRA